MKTYKKITAIMLIALVAISTLSIIAPSARAADKFFTAEISPLTMYAGLPSSYTITLTNIGPNSIGTANITIPYGFTDVTTPAITTSSGVTWEVWFFSTNLICLKPTHPTQVIDSGEVLSATFVATAPSSPGNYVWTVYCTTNTGLGGQEFTIQGIQPFLTVTPIIHLNPTTGPVGTPVTITGSNFAPSSPITFTYDSSLLGTSQSDSSGLLPSSGVTLIIPASTAGNHPIKATDASGNMVSANFIVTPKIQLSLTAGPVDTLVTVSGTGFASGSSLTATFNSLSITLGGVTSTDSVGSFSGATFTVPPSSIGTKTITITDSSPNHNQASTTFNVGLASPTVSISLSSSSISAGSSIIVSALLSEATSNAGGSVTYTLYSGSYPLGTSIDTDIKTVVNQIAPDSKSFVINTAADYYIIAQYSGDENNNPAESDPSTLTVTHADSVFSLSISPKTATIIAGQSVSYSATAYDEFGNSWSVAAVYTCPDSNLEITNNVVSSNVANTYILTGSYGGQSDTAVLEITAASLNSILIAPKTASISAGDSQVYSAEAFDEFGNSLGDVSGSATWIINSGLETYTWTGSSVQVTKAGEWTVTAEYNGNFDTATLTVASASTGATHFVVSAPASVIAGQSFSVTITAQDQYGNTVKEYAGKLHFTSSDIQAALPDDTSLANGVGTLSVILKTAGSQVITVTDIADSEIAGNSDEILVNSNIDSPGYIVITPSSATIAAGGSQTFTAQLFDEFGNTLGDITGSVDWGINSGDGTYSWNENTVVVNKAGDWTVTASYAGVPDATAILTVVGHIAPTSIIITPKAASVAAGASQAFVATASDGYNTWDVTNSVVWSIEAAAEGSWIQSTGTYTSAKAGTWEVVATLDSVSDTASLTVTANQLYLDSIVVSPKISTIIAGGFQLYSVEAFDIYGNSLGDITSASAFSVNSVPITGNQVTETLVGSYTIIASYEGLTDYATLTVNAAPLDHIVISPAETTIVAGGSQVYSVEAYDQYENSLGDVSLESSFKINDVSIAGNSVTEKLVGFYTITASYSGLTDSASLTVTGYSVTFTQTGLPAGTAWNVVFDGIVYYPLEMGNIVIDDVSAIGYSWSTSQFIQTDSTRYVASVTSGSVVITGSITIDLVYQTQYYITITSTHGSPTQTSQWINAGNSLAVSITSPEGDTTHRWICTGYSTDSALPTEGTSYQFINIQASHTIIFNWQEQYYLTVNSQYSSTNGAGWYNAGTAATASVASGTVSGAAGTKYVFTAWSDDASGSGLASNPIIMNSPQTATANWKTQYYLTVTSAYGNPTGQGWYDAGSRASIALTQTVISGANTRNVFTSWTGSGSGAYSGTATTQSISMNGPITETAQWKTQYLVSYAATGNALAVMVPSNEWVDYGTAAKGIFLPLITNQVSETRCVFIKDNRPSTIIQPIQITATYQTQYVVTFNQNGIESDAVGTIITMFDISKEYSQLAHQTWVNKGAIITFSFADTVASTVADKMYALTGVNTSSPVTIDAPTIIQATYEAQYSLYTTALAALLILLLILLLLMLLAWRRRRKKKQEQKAI